VIVAKMVCAVVMRGVDVQAGAHFSCEKADEGETQPLGEVERLQELLLGVLERWVDGVYGGDWGWTRHGASWEPAWF
jgi:hypothetical protein